MATFIDPTLLEGLKPIFIFLLIFAIVYALLSMSRVLGENKSIHAIIAFVVGVLMVLSGKVVEVVVVMIPWFVLLAIFIVLVIMVYKGLGTSDEGIKDALKERTFIGTTIGIIVVIIIIASISAVFGQQELDVTKDNTSQFTYRGDDYNPDSPELRGEDGNLRTDTDDFETNARNTIYHPRMLGFILIMIIGIFTVSQLTKPAS